MPILHSGDKAREKVKGNWAKLSHFFRWESKNLARILSSL